MDRFKELRKKAGFSQAALAKILNVHQTAISQWELGKSYPEMDTIKKMAELYNVPIDYIVGRQSCPDIPPSTGGVWIPVLGHVAAGIPIEAVEDIEDYEEISLDTAEQGDYFALKIQGDSMEPKISNGDVVIVRKQDDCDNNDIAVVIINGGEATVKRIKKTPEGIMLIPSNQYYEPMFYSNEDIKKLPIKILGKVIELRAKF